MKRELSELIQKDFSFTNVLVTINDVDMTPDLKNAHVFVGIIGEDRQKEEVIEKLNAKRGMLQSKISRRVVLKYTPQLFFKLDGSVERGVRVVALMDQLDEICPPAEDAEPEDEEPSAGAGDS